MFLRYFSQVDAIESNEHQQVIGFLAFCGPGLFNALNGLGNVAWWCFIRSGLGSGYLPEIGWLVEIWIVISIFVGAMFTLHKWLVYDCFNNITENKGRTFDLIGVAKIFRPRCNGWVDA